MPRIFQEQLSPKYLKKQLQQKYFKKKSPQNIWRNIFKNMSWKDSPKNISRTNFQTGHASYCVGGFFGGVALRRNLEANAKRGVNTMVLKQHRQKKK